MRRERSLPYTQAIAGALNLMPRWYIGSILRHVDFLASNVGSIRAPVSVGGAVVRSAYAFGPTIGAPAQPSCCDRTGREDPKPSLEPIAPQDALDGA